jgi:hypothetical protein
MASRDPGYTTKELSKSTWSDFEWLFMQGNGWDHRWCMAFQRDRSRSRGRERTRAEKSVKNREDKRRLVDEEGAHGILVYAHGEPCRLVSVWLCTGALERRQAQDQRTYG